MKVSPEFYFVSFLNSGANIYAHPLASEKCQQEKRKTVNGEDILFAMTSLGFENYAEALKIYLSKYREVSLEQRLFSFLSLFKNQHILTGILSQTQSARGENQRPSSSGYGAAAGRPGTSGGFADPGNSSTVMNPTLDPSDQDTTGYGYPSMVGHAHNTAGGESY